MLVEFIRISGVHDDTDTCVTVALTPEQIEDLIDGLQYLLAGGRTLYLQDEHVIVQLKKLIDERR